MLTFFIVVASIIGYIFIGLLSRKFLYALMQNRYYKQIKDTYKLPYYTETRGKSRTEIEYLRLKSAWKESKSMMYKNDADVMCTVLGIFWPAGVPLFLAYLLACKINSGMAFKPRVEKELEAMQKELETHKAIVENTRSLIVESRNQGRDTTELERLLSQLVK